MKHSAQSQVFVPPEGRPFLNVIPILVSIVSRPPQRWHENMCGGATARMRLLTRSFGVSGGGVPSMTLKSGTGSF